MVICTDFVDCDVTCRFDIRSGKLQDEAHIEAFACRELKLIRDESVHRAKRDERDPIIYSRSRRKPSRGVRRRERFVNFEISQGGDLRLKRVLCAVKSLKPDLITYNINTPTKQVLESLGRKDKAGK